MSSKKLKEIRSISLSNFECYRTEEINKIFRDSENQNMLLLHYIDNIRNCNEITDEMIKKIKEFNDDNKMKIIQEYNHLVKYLIEYITIS